MPEVPQADLLGVQAGVGFQAPAEVGAAPGTEAMAPGGVPEEAEGFEEHAGERATEIIGCGELGSDGDWCLRATCR